MQRARSGQPGMSPPQAAAPMSATMPLGGMGGGCGGGGGGDFRGLREQLYSSLSGAGLPLPPNRSPDAQDFRFLTEWLLRMREVQTHGQGELKMARNEISRLMDRVAALEKLVHCLSLTLHCLSSTFHCLLLTVHRPAGAREGRRDHRAVG